MTTDVSFVRGPGGRFAKGTKGGPGAPAYLQQQYGRIRKALYEAVTDADVAAIAKALKNSAKEGDPISARVLLEFLIPKPTSEAELMKLEGSTGQTFIQIVGANFGEPDESQDPREAPYQAPWPPLRPLPG